MFFNLSSATLYLMHTPVMCYVYQQTQKAKGQDPFMRRRRRHHERKPTALDHFLKACMHKHFGGVLLLATKTHQPTSCSPLPHPTIKLEQHNTYVRVVDAEWLLVFCVSALHISGRERHHSSRLPSAAKQQQHRMVSTSVDALTLLVVVVVATHFCVPSVSTAPTRTSATTAGRAP